MEKYDTHIINAIRAMAQDLFSKNIEKRMNEELAAKMAVRHAMAFYKEWVIAIKPILDEENQPQPRPYLVREPKK